MLLTGADPHLVGVGNMKELLTKEQAASPNYQGHFNDNTATVAQRLEQAGYYTLMSGKWHLGLDEAHSPDKWGFQNSFAMLRGEANHFKHIDKVPSPDGADVYRVDGKITDIPDTFYSSDAYAAYLIEKLQHKPADKPFFAYLAFTAPHSPLQAPEETIKKYEKYYLDGPQKLADQRITRIKKLNLIDRHVQPHKLVNTKNWNTLSPAERAAESRRMQTYAAMIDRMDYNIGRVVQALKQNGELENTVIFFMSDNGAAGGLRETNPKWGPWIRSMRNNNLTNMGTGSSYISTGPDWAQASMSPFYLFKGYTTEGGLRSPMIIAGPNIAKGKIDGTSVNLKDLTPTILDLAHASKETPAGKIPIQGSSISASLQHPKLDVSAPHLPSALEMKGGREIRQGRYKALYITHDPAGITSEEIKRETWQLFDIQKDPGENNDIANRHPEILKRLIGDYEKYSRDAGVVELTPIQ